jgi:alpha-glucosidase (family GH31 glycosyl hydrolase)
MKLGVRMWAGTAHDEFIQLTEGVMASEELDDPVDEPLRPEAREPGGPHHEIVTVSAPAGVHRVGLVLPGHPQQQFVGIGARHGLHVDQSGRTLQLGADRAYTGPDCPPDMLELGGIPQGDYAPVPWLLGSRGWAAWIETEGHGARLDLGDEVVLSTRRDAGPLRVHLFTHPTPFARLRAFLRLTGLPPVLPEWAYGHWKSRDVYNHETEAQADVDGYRRHDLPLDAIVLDSPLPRAERSSPLRSATQYNTWEFNPHQFPNAAGMIARWRVDGVRTVV